jgi:hypothetical protein
MRRLLIISLLFLSLTVSATKYYVKNGGSDIAAGTSDGAAWATISKVNSVALSAGDSVLFKRGSTWREILTVDNGSAAARIYYGAYGTGAKPLLFNSADVLAGWTNLGSNIWQNTNAAFTRRVGFLIFNNEESIGSNKYTEAELTEQGDFWHDYTNHLVKMYSASNPATYYSVIEASLSGQTVSISNNRYITFENLDFRYSGEGTIYCFYSHDITVRSCDFSFNGGCFWHPEINNQRIGGGTGCYGATGYNVYNMLFEKNYLFNEFEGTLSSSGGDGVYSMENIIFRNNVVSSSELGIEYWVGAGALVSDIYFEHNTFINMGGGMAHLERPSVRGHGIAIYTSLANESNVFIRNNIFYGCTESLVYFEVTDDVNDVVIDYNVYYPLGASPMFQISFHTYNTFASWQTNPYGAQDAHSIEAYPDFMSATDYHLRSSSPAIGIGLTTTKVTTDFDDVEFGIPPSIGAFENVGIEPPGIITLGTGTGSNIMVDKNGRIIVIR